MDEQKLTKLYMDLTGSNESAARSVLMYVLPEPEPRVGAGGGPVRKGSGAPPPEVATSRRQSPASAPGFARPAVSAALGALCLLLGFACPASGALGRDGTNTAAVFSQPLSLADAVNLALQLNPNLQRARKDLEATHGIAVQTRAILLPKLVAAGNYGAVQGSDIDTFRTPGVTFGNSENWATQLKLVQSFFEGGRMLSSIRVARLVQQQAVLNYQTALADTVLAVQTGYYDVLLAQQQIAVQEASIELLTSELRDTQRRFEAGTVPRFNVLRAEVELAGARPRLITARNSFRIAKNNLANLLGVDLPREALEDIPLTLAGKLDDEPFKVELRNAIAQALESRTELEALRKAQALRKEDLVSARAGYLPALQGYAGYDVHNSMLSQDLTVERHGWMAGAQITWNIFDGLATRGRVIETRARLDRAQIDLDDASRRIELEVRTAYSNFIEAREVIESQKKVVEQAEEALRLAKARAEAGTGTQLDVLGAQTSLTQARTTQIQALHEYDLARARLQRAIGADSADNHQAQAP
jgi:outer membrane protein